MYSYEKKKNTFLTRAITSGITKSTLLTQFCYDTSFVILSLAKKKTQSIIV